MRHAARTWETEGVVCGIDEWSPLGAATGPAVVLLPGLLAVNRHWEPVARLLASEYRCLALEVPYTAMPGRWCSLAGIVELARRFVESECPGPVVLVGSSIGGHAGARLAMDAPEKVAGLVLAGAGGLRERAPMFEVTLAPSREWIAARFGVMFHDPRYVTDDELDRVAGLFRNRGALRSFVRLARSSRDDELEGDLGRVRAPTLVLWGREDKVTPPDCAEAFTAGIPGARLEWIERCGHAPMIEEPEQFVLHTRAFLREIG